MVIEHIFVVVGGDADYVLVLVVSAAAEHF
jgi:hypothetical protein